MVRIFRRLDKSGGICMRVVFLGLIFFLITIACGVAENCSAQGYPTQSGEDYDVPLVKRALGEQAQGASFSFTNKYLTRLGDRVSVALLKILEEKDFQNSRQLRAALKVMRQSFSSLDLVVVPEDQKPKVTLFFLNRMERETNDPKLRQEISSLIRFINDNVEEFRKRTRKSPD